MMNTLRIALVGCLTGMAAIAASSAVTFNKDVLPILQKNCQGCHRPGEVAPMSLLTYSDARLSLLPRGKSGPTLAAAK
jgi:hypothetical protein